MNCVITQPGSSLMYIFDTTQSPPPAYVVPLVNLTDVETVLLTFTTYNNSIYCLYCDLEINPSFLLIAYINTTSYTTTLVANISLNGLAQFCRFRVFHDQSPSLPGLVTLQGWNGIWLLNLNEFTLSYPQSDWLFSGDVLLESYAYTLRPDNSLLLYFSYFNRNTGQTWLNVSVLAHYSNWSSQISNTQLQFPCQSIVSLTRISDTNQAIAVCTDDPGTVIELLYDGVRDVFYQLTAITRSQCDLNPLINSEEQNLGTRVIMGASASIFIQCTSGLMRFSSLGVSATVLSIGSYVSASEYYYVSINENTGQIYTVGDSSPLLAINGGKVTTLASALAGFVILALESSGPGGIDTLYIGGGQSALTSSGVLKLEIDASYNVKNTTLIDPALCPQAISGVLDRVNGMLLTTCTVFSELGNYNAIYRLDLYNMSLTRVFYELSSANCKADQISYDVQRNIVYAGCSQNSLLAVDLNSVNYTVHILSYFFFCGIVIVHPTTHILLAACDFEGAAPHI